MAKIAPQLPIEVDSETGVWTSDALPMLYVPRHFFVNNHMGIEEVLGAFVTQYYLEQRPPREIVLSHAIPDVELLQEVFSAQAGRKVEIKPVVRGERARYLDIARQNAALALATALLDAPAARAAMAARGRALAGRMFSPAVAVEQVVAGLR